MSKSIVQNNIHKLLPKNDLGTKKEIIKSNAPEQAGLVEENIQKIHGTPEKKAVREKEATRRVTLDIPISLHKKIMLRIVDQDLLIKDYFINLAKADIENK